MGASAVDAIINQLLRKYKPGFDLSLEPIRALLAKLGNPHRDLPPIIHIAGTNGKGSMAAFARALLEASGHKMHVHSSPHLVNWRERFRIPLKDGQSAFIADNILAELLSDIARINGDAKITLFEILTAAAFMLFKHYPSDAIILETGLGGRFDATNIISQNACAIIGPISYDHEAYLGHKISQIAFEKCGIIKPNCPVVIAKQDYSEASSEIIKNCHSKKAPYLRYDSHFFARQLDDAMIFRARGETLKLTLPALKGRHQIQNAATALMAVRQAGFQPSIEQINQAWRAVSWPARMQQLKNGTIAMAFQQYDSEIWIDGGHNPQAGREVAATLQELTIEQKSSQKPSKLIIIMAMLATKAYGAYLQQLAKLDLANIELITVNLQSKEQNVPSDILCQAAQSLGFKAQSAHDLNSALTLAKGIIEQQQQPFRILIAGSLYLCGEMLALNNTPPC